MKSKEMKKSKKTINDCRNCKLFEKANYINFCNNSKFGIIALPKGIYNKCPSWEKKKE